MNTNRDDLTEIYRKEYSTILWNKAKRLSDYKVNVIDLSFRSAFFGAIWFFLTLMSCGIVHSSYKVHGYLGYTITTPKLIAQSNWLNRRALSAKYLMNPKKVNLLMHISEAGYAKPQMAEYILENAIQDNITGAKSIRPAIRVLQGIASKTGKIPSIGGSHSQQITHILTEYLKNPIQAQKYSQVRYTKDNESYHSIERIPYDFLWMGTLGFEGSAVILLLSGYGLKYWENRIRNTRMSL